MMSLRLDFFRYSLMKRDRQEKGLLPRFTSTKKVAGKCHHKYIEA